MELTDEDKLWHLLERVPGLLMRTDELFARDDLGASRYNHTERLWRDLHQLRAEPRAWKMSLYHKHDLQELPLVPSTSALLGESAILMQAFPERCNLPNATIKDLLIIYSHYEMFLGEAFL